MSTLQTPPTKQEIAAILRDAAALVEAGDSFEGTISWSLIDDALDARYRIGNLQGQGGMRVIQFDPPPEQET